MAAALMGTTVAKAQVPEFQDDHLFPFLMQVRAAECDPTDDTVGLITASTPLTALVFNHNRSGTPVPPASCNPVMAPDGHQMTLGEFKAVTGKVALRCTDMGTRALLHFSGLQPNGVYTVWLFLENPPNAPPPYLAGGTLGRTALSENRVQVNGIGEGYLQVTTPDEDLSAFGHVGPCFLLDSDVQLHLVYHIDQTTHGPLPGPNSTWVVTSHFFVP